MKSKVCEFCGASISRNDIFCRGCGAKVNNNEVVKDAIIESDKKNNNIGFILGVIIILLVLIILFGLFYLIK